MLIVALVLAVIGLAALVLAVVTSNALIAWVCIAASVIGVILLIVDALRDRSKSAADEAATEDDRVDDAGGEPAVEDYPDEAPIASEAEDYPADEPVPAAERSDEDPAKS
ncbi:DUF308 domain-containing protein [Mycobacterium sp. C3-094]|uniref:DUF308 domain-containing protein n=1 Tax=Mycobacterium sp. PSTR-4-N TaxID=2917745 RepID=UPI001F153592|nr:DUF308 domain-containing protein [Mycobacterium sp. PSTR-4-N]MCG7597789.1 DUF308 domain-containing protein [Mycobacterium sp. PSTR-4-N]